MASALDPAALARAVAEIAGQTSDPDTARRLLDLVETLLKAAGLDTQGNPPHAGNRPG